LRILSPICNFFVLGRFFSNIGTLFDFTILFVIVPELFLLLRWARMLGLLSIRSMEVKHGVYIYIYISIYHTYVRYVYTYVHTLSICRDARYAASCSSLRRRSAFIFSSCFALAPPKANPCSSTVLCSVSTSSAGEIGPSIYTWTVTGEKQKIASIIVI
jgi:hypothetical protein